MKIAQNLENKAVPIGITVLFILFLAVLDATRSVDHPTPTQTPTITPRKSSRPRSIETTDDNQHHPHANRSRPDKPRSKWKIANESNIETAQRLEWDWDCELLMRFDTGQKLTSEEAEDAQRIVDVAYAHRCASIEKLTEPRK